MITYELLAVGDEQLMAEATQFHHGTACLGEGKRKSIYDAIFDFASIAGRQVERTSAC